LRVGAQKPEGVDYGKYVNCEKVYVGDAAIGGNGLFTRVPIKKGEVIEKCVMVPMKGPEDLGHYNSHLFTWSDDRKIWAIGSGMAMFINYSDKPNCMKKRDMVGNTMEIIALHDIPAHTELLSTYYSK